MWWKKAVLGLSLLALLSPLAGVADPVRPKVQEILSDVYHVDKKYRSMMGPSSTRKIRASARHGELMWIVGYQAEMVKADGVEKLPQEFMCHSNLDIDPLKHAEVMGINRIVNGRLFTLSQGQTEIHFPPGFGIPVRSDEVMDLTTQVLNLNIDNPQDLKVRHKVGLRMIAQKELKRPLKPLYEEAVYVTRLLDANDCKLEEKKSGICCLPARSASESYYTDPHGRQTTGHWVVPPGREVAQTDVTRMLNLKQNTTAHYIAVHLHPFAESLELMDATTKKSVFKAYARNYRDKIGLEHIGYYSSEKGLPLYAGHKYTLISTYNNTSGEEQDAMAVMYIYLLDKELQQKLSRK